MRLLLLISMSLTTVATVVAGNAGWGQQTCEDGRDAAESISACTRLIEGANLDDFTTALYNRGIRLTPWVRSNERSRTSRELSKLEPLTGRLIMVVEMLTS